MPYYRQKLDGYPIGPVLSGVPGRRDTAHESYDVVLFDNQTWAFPWNVIEVEGEVTDSVGFSHPDTSQAISHDGMRDFMCVVLQSIAEARSTCLETGEQAQELIQKIRSREV